MKLSTMTNWFYHNQQTGVSGYCEAIQKTAAIGFDTMDLNMCAIIRPTEQLLNTDDWERIAHEIRETAEKAGVTLAQAHLPYQARPARLCKSTTEPGAVQDPYYQQMLERSVRVCGIVGVKWAVIHPTQCLPGDNQDLEKDIACNHESYDRIIELANSLNVGIAYENMFDAPNFRNFAVTAQELCALIDSYQSPLVGVCWDFGHAHLTYPDQTHALRMLGHRLKATHVNDNLRAADIHTLPMMGSIDWARVMPVLHEIGYEGAFNYEVKLTTYMKDAPIELKEQLARYAYELGNYLISLAK